MTYYYVHDESGCAFLSQDPPAVVMTEPCVELVDRERYLRACAEYGETPAPHPDPCLETRRRIRVAVAAWAYEIHNDPVMGDAEFDALAREIDLDRSTANSDLDQWFVSNFQPDTGMWVRDHPNKDGLERIYRLLRGAESPSRKPSLVWNPEAISLWMCAA